MKITTELESIFSMALSLDQSGRFKNSIHGKGEKIFILNFDKTVLIQFLSGGSNLDKEFNFFANDYLSPEFRFEEDGRITFMKRGGEFDLFQTSKVPEDTYGEVSEFFESLRFKAKNKISISRDTATGLIADDLSHIEVYGKGGKLILVQRDIFSGAVNTLMRPEGRGLGVSQRDDIKEDFGPMGLRTTDFKALFTFDNNLEFSFDNRKNYFWFKGAGKYQVEGIIGTCLYDELGAINYISKGGSDGGQVQKKWESEQSPNRPTGSVKESGSRLRRQA